MADMPLSLNGNLSTDETQNHPGDEAQMRMEIYQLKAMYEMTTALAGKCFDRCIAKLGTHLDEATEKPCIQNCVARFFDMKLFFTRRLLESQIQPEPVPHP